MSDKPEDEEEQEEGEETQAEAPAEEKPASPPPKPAKKPLPAWAGLAMSIAFVGLAIGVGYVLWLLANTFNLMRPDAYLYSGGRVVETLRQEDELGRGSELLIDKKPGRPARIRFLLRDGSRQPVTRAVVDIVMTRPEEPEAPPVQAKLQMLEPGVYRGEVEMNKGGLWEARVLVQEGPSSYQVVKRITLPLTEEEKAEEETKN